MHSSNPPDSQNSSSNPPAGPPNDGQPVSSSPVFGSSPGPWHTGLFETFLTIAEMVDEGTRSRAASAVIFGVLHHFFLCNGGCLYSCCYRTKLRNQYALVGSRCADCCVHWCCLSCALSQEYRELKKQGFDMTIGWERNVERRRPGMPMPLPMAPGGMAQPMAPGGMTR